MVNYWSFVKFSFYVYFTLSLSPGNRIGKLVSETARFASDRLREIWVEFSAPFLLDIRLISRSARLCLVVSSALTRAVIVAFAFAIALALMSWSCCCCCSRRLEEADEKSLIYRLFYLFVLLSDSPLRAWMRVLFGKVVYVFLLRA